MARNPEYWEAYNYLGNVMREQGQLDRALACFRQSVTINPNFVVAHNNLANALQEMGRVAEALEAFCHGLTFDPGNASARHMLAAPSEETTKQATAGFVRDIFDGNAAVFDHHSSDRLVYRAPQLLRQAVDRVLAEKPSRRTSRLGRAHDLGCGTGLAAAQFRNLVDEIHGVDISPKMVEQAKRKDLYDALWEDDLIACLDRAKAGTDHHDLIIAADVFTYIGELSSVFAAARQRLSPGGLFAFSTERLDVGAYALRQNGRYAHNDDYIRNLAASHDFAVAVCVLAELRKENDAAVVGSVCTLTRL